MFYATPAAFERVVAAMDSAAAACTGVSPVSALSRCLAVSLSLYFTIRPGGEARKAPLETLGFKHVDDDVFVRRDLGPPLKSQV